MKFLHFFEANLFYDKLPSTVLRLQYLGTYVQILRYKPHPLHYLRVEKILGQSLPQLHLMIP